MLCHAPTGGLVALGAVALYGRGPYFTGRFEGESAPQGYEGARESLLHPGSVEEP